KIEDRKRATANVRDTAHHRAGLGHVRQARALQNFLDLENVDAIELLVIQTKQQKFQTVLPDQLRALVNRIQYTGHASFPLAWCWAIRVTQRHAPCFEWNMSEQTTMLRRFGKLLCNAIFLPALLGLSQLVDAAAVTRPQQLIDVTHDFLEQSVTDYLQRSQIQGRHEVEVTRLDPRLRLAQCDTPLSTRLESPAQPV